MGLHVWLHRIVFNFIDKKHDRIYSCKDEENSLLQVCHCQHISFIHTSRCGDRIQKARCCLKEKREDLKCAREQDATKDHITAVFTIYMEDNTALSVILNLLLFQ